MHQNWCTSNFHLVFFFLCHIFIMYIMPCVFSKNGVLAMTFPILKKINYPPHPNNIFWIWSIILKQELFVLPPITLGVTMKRCFFGVPLWYREHFSSKKKYFKTCGLLVKNVYLHQVKENSWNTWKHICVKSEACVWIITWSMTDLKLNFKQNEMN